MLPGDLSPGPGGGSVDRKILSHDRGQRGEDGGVGLSRRGHRRVARVRDCPSLSPWRPCGASQELEDVKWSEGEGGVKFRTSRVLTAPLPSSLRLPKEGQARPPPGPAAAPPSVRDRGAPGPVSAGDRGPEGECPRAPVPLPDHTVQPLGALAQGVTFPGHSPDSETTLAKRCVRCAHSGPGVGSGSPPPRLTHPTRCPA